jgi:hypothetical protein
MTSGLEDVVCALGDVYVPMKQTVINVLPHVLLFGI